MSHLKARRFICIGFQQKIIYFFTILALKYHWNFWLYLYVEKDLTQITSVDDYQPSMPSIIVDRNENVLKEMGSENRAIVKIEDVLEESSIVF